MEHAKLSPSSAHRWMICTASPDVEWGLPDDATFYAEEGRLSHEIAARALLSGKDADTYLGRTSEDGKHQFTPSLAEGVQTYLDAVRFVVDTSLGKLYVEQKSQLSDDIWGTVDAACVSHDGKHLHCFDLKMGAGTYVDVANNPQLLIYAGGMLNKSYTSNVETVTIAIVQPRHHRGPAWRYQTLSREALSGALVKIREKGAETVTNPKFVPGEHCAFCRARATCGARAKSIKQSAKEAFSATPCADLTDEDIARLLPKQKEVASWFNDLYVYAQKRALMGVTIPGYKLVQGYGNRVFTDPKTAPAVLRSMGVDPLTAPSLVSVAEAERRLAKKTTPKHAKAAIEGLVMKPKKDVTLQPESDSRPEVAITAFSETKP